MLKRILTLTITVCVLLTLTGCGKSVEQINAELKAERVRSEITMKHEALRHENKLKEIEAHKNSEIALSQTEGYAEKVKADAEAKLLLEQASAASASARSLKYLENSQQTHDTLEALGVGLSIFGAMSE